jgi:hypothetical protein
MSTEGRRRPGCGWRRRPYRLAALLVFGSVTAGVGCRSAVDVPALDAAALADGREALSKPLSGDLAALYHVRVPSSGALRLAVLSNGGD